MENSTDRAVVALRLQGISKNSQMGRDPLESRPGEAGIRRTGYGANGLF